MSPWDDLIKRYRRLHGLTQAAFAEMIGVEQATVSRWERGFHLPDLSMQRRLRDLMRRATTIANDRMVLHRVRGAISPMKLADHRGRNHAVSRLAAVLHGVDILKLERMDYTPYFTEILSSQWRVVSDLGFFRGDVASVHVFNTWQPACGGNVRYCEGYWTPALLSDGEVMLVSEFHDIDEQAFLSVPEHKRVNATMVDELLH